MQKDGFLLPLVLIRQYSHPNCIEEAIYNYIKYIEDITLRNYNENQIDTACKYAFNIIHKWYLPNNNIWNNSINNWLENNPKNKIYHEIILQLLLIKEDNKTNNLIIL